jgi:hypothetical protein
LQQDFGVLRVVRHVAHAAAVTDAEIKQSIQPEQQ